MKVIHPPFMPVTFSTQTMKLLQSEVHRTFRARVSFTCCSLFAFSALFLIGPSKAEAATYDLKSFDGNCGKANYNCRPAFQKAFSALASSGGGTLQLPAGSFFIDFPELAGATKFTPLSRNSLLVVPPKTIIQGHVGTGGVPDSTVIWKSSIVPVFIFSTSSGSGVRDLHGQFAGTSPAVYSAFPFGDVNVLKALGHNTTSQAQNFISGGNYELFTFIWSIDSDNCTFNNLVFDSATKDNNHIFGFALVLKGENLVESNGKAGMQDFASSNTVSNIKLYDYVDGILVSGQSNLVIKNIASDRRGSSTAIPPGHVIYTTGTPVFDAGGHIVKMLGNKNVSISNVNEGPDTYSNEVALGTLAVKAVNGGQVTNVTSAHPAGLLQTIQAVQNVTFSNLTWQSSYDLCAAAPKNCATPVLNMITSQAGELPSSNVTFKQIVLKSSKTPITVTLDGDNLVVNGLDIETPPDFLPNQANVNAVVGIRDTTKAEIDNYTYSPLINSHDPRGKYNSPLTAWNTASNVNGKVTVKWPSYLDMPAQTESIVRADSQSKVMNNSIKASVQPK